ncbi:MAG TPA: quinolinate synthase NadA [Thermoguttaceae bacterium]|nr:quinolinate synthase NadA [Thermoguttaceae bacterium]
MHSVEAPRPLLPYLRLERDDLIARITAVRRRWGSRLLILGHHYQRDDVIAMTDLRGDSYKLCELAAANEQCRAIVFCGVHFMAETADVLANPPAMIARRGGQRVDVILPDLAAGCSMADLANVEQVESCWQQLAQVIDVDQVMPVTYVNSSAGLKAFCGRHGGIVCTSSNAAAALDWSFARRQRVLFFPDQHLGRNTAGAMGIPLSEMPVWDPEQPALGGNDEAALRAARVILWRGHCSVHQVFEPQHVREIRRRVPGVKVIVHPECAREVVSEADGTGSTGAIIRQVEASPPGTRWAIGTELNLVNRLRNEHPDQEIHYLASTVGVCPTMYRIDLSNLCWSLENLDAGTPVNVIRVDDETAHGALSALQRMLEVK